MEYFVAKSLQGVCIYVVKYISVQGVALIKKTIQSALDKRLVMWEEYCLNHCFEVPEGFSLSKGVMFFASESFLCVHRYLASALHFLHFDVLYNSTSF